MLSFLNTHQARLSTTFDSNHVPNTVVKKDPPASNNFKLNIANGMASYQKNPNKTCDDLRHPAMDINLLNFLNFQTAVKSLQLNVLGMRGTEACEFFAFHFFDVYYILNG